MTGWERESRKQKIAQCVWHISTYMSPVCGLGASTETCTYACISTLYMSLPCACTFPTHAFPHGHTYNNSCVDGVLAKTHASNFAKEESTVPLLDLQAKGLP